MKVCHRSGKDCHKKECDSIFLSNKTEMFSNIRLEKRLFCNRLSTVVVINGLVVVALAATGASCAITLNFSELL